MSKMEKNHLEICIISAHGLGRPSFFWKPQWFAVGWIDPNNKYCTKVDSSGSSNPTWKTKFLVPIDDTISNLQGLSLTIEVYRRDPIFPREKLQGTAAIMLKEFFMESGRDETSSSGVDDTVRLQLHKRSSGKPQGFVDVSIHIFPEKEGVYSHSGIWHIAFCL